MLKRLCSFFLIVLCLSYPCFVLGKSNKDRTNDAWVTMPVGARPTYMGIHGGTMPVSLLVSVDGSVMLAFVGRTGNDLLEVLYSTAMPMPSLFKPDKERSIFSSPSLEIFGLSEKAVSAEGRVRKPTIISAGKKKYYRLFFQQSHFKPR